MFASLLQLLQTPRFLLAMSLSTVTAGAVAGPLAIQAIRSEPAVAAQDDQPSTTIEPVVQGITTLAPDPEPEGTATNEIAASELTDNSTPLPGTDADAAPGERPETPPSTRQPNVAPVPTQAPTSSSTTAAPASVTTAPDPGPVAPTVTQPTTTAAPKTTVKPTPTTATTLAPEPPVTTDAPRTTPPDPSISTIGPTLVTDPTGPVVVTTEPPVTTAPVATTEQPVDKTNNGRGQDGNDDRDDSDNGDDSWWDDIIDAISGN